MFQMPYLLKMIQNLKRDTTFQKTAYCLTSGKFCKYNSLLIAYICCVLILCTDLPENKTSLLGVPSGFSIYKPRVKLFFILYIFIYMYIYWFASFHCWIYLYERVNMAKLMTT